MATIGSLLQYCVPVRIKLEDIYPDLSLQIPKGYSNFQFKIVEPGEKYLDTNGHVKTHTYSTQEVNWKFARLVLIPDPPKPQELIRCEMHDKGAIYIPEFMGYYRRKRVPNDPDFWGYNCEHP